MGKIVLVTGGARSGKSAFAEKFAESAGNRVAYVATAEALDAEMEARVAKHRSRRPDNWKTFEAPIHAEQALSEAAACADAVLFDCLTVYVSNALLSQPEFADQRERCDAVLAAVDSLIAAAGDFPGTVVFVTNEVGNGIVPDNALAREFRDIAGLANQKVAKAASQVFLVVCGLPLELKNNAVMGERKS